LFKKKQMAASMNMGPVVPKQLNYSDVLPIAIESWSNKRTFEPINGSKFSPAGTNVIRLNINSDNLVDFTHSYLQVTLTNTSAANLALDVGIPWLNRLQIMSGGQELENIDSYNRLHAIMQSVQGNPAQAGEFGLTQKENFPSEVTPTGTTSFGAADALDIAGFAANELVPSTTNFSDAATSGGHVDPANAAAATALAINDLTEELRVKANARLEAVRVQLEALRGEIEADDTRIAQSLTPLRHNATNRNQLADTHKFTYNINLISAILSQPKYFPLIFTNLGLDIFMYLEDGINIGVYDGAPAGGDGGYTIENVRYHCHLVDVDKGFYDRMRQSMMSSGGVLQFSGTTYKHYLDTHPNTAGPHNIQISTRVKSLNNLYVRPQRSVLNNRSTHFCISQGETFGMTDYQFRIGSMVYPQQRVVVDAGNNASNLGESYNELRKCVGVLGNYMHNSYLNPRTYRLGPGSSQTPAVFDNGDAVGITVNAGNDFLGNSSTSGDTKNLFVAAYGFEGFAKTAAESGINVSDRALPVVCEVNRVEVTRANGAAISTQVCYDIFAQTDMIIYLTADGQLSTQV
jgi:hypothetical protein